MLLVKFLLNSVVISLDAIWSTADCQEIVRDAHASWKLSGKVPEEN